jgi:uncharacterized protein YjeT (DUF2065 family)
MEFFLKHKIIILRAIGGVLLLIGFAVHFWTRPTTRISENEIAAANVARMEASVAGHSSNVKKAKPDMSILAKSLTSAQQQRAKYITIFAMVLGVLLLGASFLKKEED